MGKDLSLRKNQVYRNATDNGIGLEDFVTSTMSIQKHEAERAGMHYDIRLNINGKAVSFATRKGLPDKPGSPRLLIRQPDHKIDYMNWEGTIPKGEYGAGKVRVADKQPVVIGETNGHIKLHVAKGPNAGNYTIFRTEGNNWMASRHSDMPRTWEDRPKYKDTKRDLQDLPEEQYLASRKYDGAHFIAHLSNKGIALTSQRKGKNGNMIAREDNFPHIKYTKVPKDYQGTVLRGEIHHKNGFNTLSGMALALPHNSVKLQEEKGKVEFIPFDIIKHKGKYFTEYTAEERAKIVEEVAKALPNNYIYPPDRKRKTESLREFYDRIVTDKGEGIILQDKASGSYLKKKNRADYDLTVKEILEGTGRLKGSMGSLVLADRSGIIVGNVGTGFTDALRQEIFKNKKKYIGRLVKVESDPPIVAKSLRAPSYVGFTTDKSTPDLL